jgi:hypothetical protein
MGKEDDDTLEKSFMERFRSEGGRSKRSLAASRWEERENREERRRSQLNRYTDKDVSLSGALLCYKGTSNALSVNVT